MDDDLKAVVERVANFSLHLSNRRIAFKAAFAAAYGHDAGPQKSALNADLRTLLSALRQRDEALEPFAKIGGQMMRTPDQRPLTMHGNAVEPDGIPSKGTWTGLTAGHFRKARAILTGSETNAR